MKYLKEMGVSGEWLKASELENGTKLEIVGETKSVSGKFGDQDVCKVKTNGAADPKNARVNRTSLNALVDAFGEESIEWIGKKVTAQVEKAIVGGKRVHILYLVPEGYALIDGDDGFMKITKGDDDPGPKEETIDADKIEF